MSVPSYGRLRFERTAAHDAEVAKLHKSRVQYVSGEHRGRCPCLWVGEWRPTRAEAQEDAAEHVRLAP